MDSQFLDKSLISEIVNPSNKLMQAYLRLIDCIIHDLTTPLVTMQLQGGALNEVLPSLLKAYHLALDHHLMEPEIERHKLKGLENDSIFNVKQGAEKQLDFLRQLSDWRKQLVLDSSTIEPLSIKRVIEEWLADYPFPEPQNRSLLSVDIQHDFTFKSVPPFITQLLSHLLDNAFCYIKWAGKGDIRVWVSQDNHHHLLHFKDTGRGMDESQREHVFNRFFSKRNNRVVPGLGFCRLALLQAGGDIVCDAVKGEYTHFSIMFPLSKTVG